MGSHVQKRRLKCHWWRTISAWVACHSNTNILGIQKLEDPWTKSVEKDGGLYRKMTLSHILVVLCYLKNCSYFLTRPRIYPNLEQSGRPSNPGLHQNPVYISLQLLRYHLYCPPVVQPLCSLEMLRVITFSNFKSLALFDIGQRWADRN